MSDTMAQLDEQDQTVPAPVLPGLDLSAVDQRLRHIDTIQSTWGLPPLPDETKLDLASQHDVHPQGLSDFLWGVASDLNKKLNPLAADPAGAAEAQPADPAISSLDNDPNSLHNRIRRTFADLSGNPPARVLDILGPQSVKREAVRRGLLPPTTDVNTDLWDPSLNTVAQQLADKRFEERVSGDRTGSFSVNTVVDFLTDLASPSALAKGAVALGVVPDFKRLTSDVKEGRSQFFDWAHDPLDPKKFLKALAGPLQAAPGGGIVPALLGGGFSAARKELGSEANVLLPVVNDLLLASGVGEAIGIGRAAITGVRAADLVDRGVYAVRGAQAFERAQEASYLSRGLARFGPTQGAGEALARWRQLSGVAATRATVGALGRRAIVGTVERRLFPELDLYEGSPANLLGADIHSSPDMDHFKHFGSGNPLVLALDVAVAPPAYFTPGTFRPGQLAAAATQRLTAVSTDARTTAEVARGLAQIVTDPVKAEALRTKPYETLVEHFGSDTVAGAFTSWATALAAIDKDAVRIADKIPFEKDPAGWKARYLAARDGHIGQLAHIDQGDVDTFLNRLAAKAPAATAAAPRPGGLEPVAEGKVRLFRGEERLPGGEYIPLDEYLGDRPLNAARADTAGRWFHETQHEAEVYGMTLSGESRYYYVDVPAGEASATHTAELDPALMHEIRGAAAVPGEYLVSSERAAQAKRYVPAAETEVDFAVPERIKELQNRVLAASPDVDLPQARPFGYPVQVDETTGQTATKAVVSKTWGRDRQGVLDDLTALAESNGANPEVATAIKEYRDALGELPVTYDALHGAPAGVPGPQRRGSAASISRWAEDLRHSDPAISGPAQDAMNAAIEDHNLKRNGVMVKLLSGLDHGDVENHIGRFFANDENMGNFIDGWSTLRSLEQDGTLNGVKYTRALSPARRVLGQTGGEIDPVKTVVADLYDIMSHDPELVKDGYLAPLSKRLDPTRGRFALARSDSVTKQDALELLSAHGTLDKQAKTLRLLEGNSRLQAKFAAAIASGGGMSGVSRADFLDAVEASFAAAVKPGHFDPGLTESDKFTARLLHHLGVEDVGASLTSARQGVEGKLAQLELHPGWSKRFGIPQDWALADKIKQLHRMQNYLAAEVEVPEGVASHLGSYGYKVVHGAEFVAPRDVLDLVRPLTEVSHAEMNKMALGHFLTPVLNTHAGRAVTQNMHAELGARLSAAGVLSADTLKAQLARSEQGLPGSIIHALWDHIRTSQEAVDEGEKLAKAPLARLIAHAESSVVPLGLRDLGTKDVALALRNAGDVSVRNLADNDRAVNAVRSAILHSYDVGFQVNGLATLEDKFRSHNVLTDALKIFSKTDSAALLSKSRLSRAAVGAGIGAGIGGASAAIGGGDIGEGAVHGAGFGGTLGFLGHDAGRLGSRALVGGALGGVAGGLAGGHFTGGFQAGALAGAATALPGADRLVGAKFDGAEKAFAGSKWYRYGNLPDALLNLRNRVRFTLNPLFDLRRHVKSSVLAQLADLPADTHLPINNSLKALEREFGPEAATQARTMWNAAAKGEYDILDDAERFFAQRGLLGYSAKDLMASTNYRLVQQGVAPEKAADLVKKMYAYGLGRSPLEKSVNFVFFPFSFEKKLVSSAARFLTDDMSRTLVLHDALKAYDVLNKRYDLSKEWEDHLPILGQLQKLNAFEHGIGPGELGGINAPILNAFLPQLLHLGNDGSYQSVEHTVRRLVPVYNDINRMVDDVASQGHVVLSKQHITTEAEADRGYAEWNNFKTEIDKVAKEHGYEKGFASVMRNPDLTSFKEYVTAYKAQLHDKYPGFKEAQGKALVRRVANEQDIAVYRSQVDAGEPLPAAKQQLVQFDEYENEIIAQVKDTLGVNLATNPELVPPEVNREIRAAAIHLANQGDGFEALYNRYYKRLYGPISREY